MAGFLRSLPVCDSTAVERAKKMLSNTNLAIADITLQVGFSSQSHLTQQFKRITGMTPKQFANTIRI
jgi:AraC family transcriptional regulator